MSDTTTPQDNTQVALQTAVQTVMALAPALLQASATVDPRAALALQLAPLAMQTLQLGASLAQAGSMTPAQLVQVASQVNAIVAKAHNDWAAMNMPTMPAAQAAPSAPAVTVPAPA